MCLRAHPAHTSVMSTQTFQGNTSYTLSAHPNLNAKPPIQPSKVHLKTAKSPSAKELRRRLTLSEVFQSLSSSFTGQKDPASSGLDESYSLALELCATKKCLSQGQQIHTHILKSNAVDDSVFLGTKLVFMYGKCGSVTDAEQVFDRMSQRTIFTWNAMIGAYITNGEHFRALELYRTMRVSGVPLDSCTFPCILKACAELGHLHDGTEIHGLAIRLGLASNVFVANSLVGVYAKCDSLNAAMMLFERMSGIEDVVSWNSIISACTANGESMEALRLFIGMMQAGFTPSTYTYVSVIQACEEMALSKLGMAIHANVLKDSHIGDPYVANSLLVMYTRCGRVSESLRIFEDIVEKDDISWNSMLSGLVQNGLYYEALRFCRHMQGAGQKPDQASVVNLIAASARLGNMLYGMEIHAYAIRRGLDSDLLVGNTLTDFYGKHSRTNYMDSVFQRISNKDLISWTTVIAGYIQNGEHSSALELFREAQVERISVDKMMIGSILRACSGLKCISLVKEIHGYTMRKGLSDSVLHNTLVDVYGNCGFVDCAFNVFKSIEVKDIVSFTNMITCYHHNGLANYALDLFASVNQSVVEPDFISLMSILSAVASLSAMRKGKEIHAFLLRKGFVLKGSIVSALLDMYAHCGSLEDSVKVFNSTRDKDVVLWTSMINAYGMHGHGQAAIDLFKRMVNDLVVPDHVTFLAILYACSHSGLVDQGRNFFRLMRVEFKLEPWLEHYTCLVDLLGRGGHLEEALELVTTMDTVEPNGSVWCALLGACRVHSNKEIGETAAKKLLELEPDNPGNYILVSNAYAANGQWEDVVDVRTRMKGKGLKKDPACSWIEIDDKIHTFIARDRCHPESDRIYRKLTEITKKLEAEGGYVPQTDFVLQNVEEEEKVKMLRGHSERLAIAYAMLNTRTRPIRITKNLRVCGDCHSFSKLVSKVFAREIIVRDANRFHHFKYGACSCGDFW